MAPAVDRARYAAEPGVQTLLRPTWRVPGAIALFLVLEWYGATSEVSWLFLLGAWVIAVIVAALAFAAWNRNGLRLHFTVAQTVSPADELPEQIVRTAPAQALFEGDGAEIEMGLDTTRRAQGPAWISGYVAGRSVTAGTGLVPRSGWRAKVGFDRVRRGVLGASNWSIATSDPLGFFVGRRACADTDVALVFPCFTSLSRRLPVRELETATAAPRTGSGSELFGVREYRAGDSLRRIHWRSSARHGELVVREYEPPGIQTLNIAVDPAPATSEIADQVARIAASEAWDCIREGGRVGIGALTSRDMWEILEWLARYPDVEIEETLASADTVIVTADPALLQSPARRNWLIGEAEVETDVDYERVGVKWPL